MVIVTTGAAAALGPPLVTVTVSVRVWPATTLGLGARLLVTPRSADVVALGLALAVLFVVFGSVVWLLVVEVADRTVPVSTP